MKPRRPFIPDSSETSYNASASGLGKPAQRAPDDPLDEWNELHWAAAFGSFERGTQTDDEAGDKEGRRGNNSRKWPLRPAGFSSLREESPRLAGCSLPESGTMWAPAACCRHTPPPASRHVVANYKSPLRPFTTVMQEARVSGCSGRGPNFWAGSTTGTGVAVGRGEPEVLGPRGHDEGGGSSGHRDAEPGR